tara:strand:+ start:886 stop:1470 length:585 start_codon:yes stop_codon:yes gene_type:complete
MGGEQSTAEKAVLVKIQEADELKIQIERANIKGPLIEIYKEKVNEILRSARAIYSEKQKQKQKQKQLDKFNTLLKKYTIDDGGYEEYVRWYLKKDPRKAKEIKVKIEKLKENLEKKQNEVDGSFHDSAKAWTLDQYKTLLDEYNDLINTYPVYKPYKNKWEVWYENQISEQWYKEAKKQIETDLQKYQDVPLRL